MSVLVAFLAALLKLLLPALLDSKNTAEDGARDPALKKRLGNQLSAWRKVAVLAVVLGAAGCTRTIYVPHGEPVRLRETIPNAKVWVLDKNGQPIAGELDLPEGWYCLPDPGAPNE